MKASYFAHGQYLGETRILAPFQPHSIAYVCATCGELWGRVYVVGDEPTSWEVETVPCEKHHPIGVQDWGTVPGSFLLGKGQLHQREMRVTAWARAIEHLPELALKREFELTEKWYEGKLKDEQQIETE